MMNRGGPLLDLHREMNRLFDDTLRGMGIRARQIFGQRYTCGLDEIRQAVAGDTVICPDPGDPWSCALAADRLDALALR